MTIIVTQSKISNVPVLFYINQAAAQCLYSSVNNGFIFLFKDKTLLKFIQNSKNRNTFFTFPRRACFQTT